MRSILILITVLFMTAPLHAEVIAGHELSHAEGLVQDMSSKLNRGIVNILTGWGEIPRQMGIAGREKGWWAVLPIGLPSGVIMTVVRTLTGAFETISFAAPVNDSYDPILDPAYVWQKAAQ